MKWLRYLDKELALKCMAVPSVSEMEFRMVNFATRWADENNVICEKDKFGNVYLKKGTLDDGEYYPCLTSHLDTVHTSQIPYAFMNKPLPLEITENEEGKHVLSVKGGEIGIGADDKCGVTICLNMFQYHDKLKACLFLNEESGCYGSKNLWKEWFNDVGYVIGYDSPDLYRGAYASNGTELFPHSFYETHMKNTCDKWGLIQECFLSEPYTDVKEIREQTNVVCMNFGNGGYCAHNVGGVEYCILEDMDHALGMGIDIINSIGLKRYTEH